MLSEAHTNFPDIRQPIKCMSTAQNAVPEQTEEETSRKKLNKEALKEAKGEKR